jgi:triosephosphate isomerase
MTAQRTPLIVGNWKMNKTSGEGLELAQQVATGASGLSGDLVICPPAVLLQAICELLSTTPVAVGAQDCHTAASGAHTGDTSAPMIADLGCRYVIVGHSERRADHGEDDSTVNAKAAAAQAAGLTAIICVGESQTERDQGLTLARISAQLESSVPKSAAAANTVVAYEPIWAIGSGLTPTPTDVQDVHSHMRVYLGVLLGTDVAEPMRLLYGGSVKPENAAELLELADVDGALVGGASLDEQSFLTIARAACNAAA